MRHVRGTARRIAALRLLGGDLDRNCAGTAKSATMVAESGDPD